MLRGLCHVHKRRFKLRGASYVVEAISCKLKTRGAHEAARAAAWRKPNMLFKRVPPTITWAATWRQPNVPITCLQKAKQEPASASTIRGEGTELQRTET
eukprot:6725528-Pyramimonas_sp.AAC.1